MKLLVFAHTPPPHHGQSYMVQLMLEDFGGDGAGKVRATSPNRFGIECYHVNARFSKAWRTSANSGPKFLIILFTACRPSGAGSVTAWKIFITSRARQARRALPRLAGDAASAARFSKRSSCTGTPPAWPNGWKPRCPSASRSFTYRLMRDADLSIVLSEFNRRDAEKLTVPAHHRGRPAASLIRARNLKRKSCPAAARAPPRGKNSWPAIFKVPRHQRPNRECALVPAHCTREKGAFDAIEGVALANENWAPKNRRCVSGSRSSARNLRPTRRKRNCAN
jgi:hypothetical protein